MTWFWLTRFVTETRIVPVAKTSKTARRVTAGKTNLLARTTHALALVTSATGSGTARVAKTSWIAPSRRNATRPVGASIPASYSPMVKIDEIIKLEMKELRQCSSPYFLPRYQMGEGTAACGCRSGFRLSGDDVTCVDVDECATETYCSQLCTNTVGGFSCSCVDGYVLRPDKTSCKALGQPARLIFANRVDIRQVHTKSVLPSNELSNDGCRYHNNSLSLFCIYLAVQVSLYEEEYTSVIDGLQNAIALDFHYKKGLVIWSDVTLDAIKRAHLNGTVLPDAVWWGLKSPGGVAVDWYMRNGKTFIFSITRRISISPPFLLCSLHLVLPGKQQDPRPSVLDGFGRQAHRGESIGWHYATDNCLGERREAKSNCSASGRYG